MRGGEGHGKKLRPRLGSTRLFPLSVASRGAGDGRAWCQQDWARTSVSFVFSCVCRPFLRSPVLEGTECTCTHLLACGHVQPTELCQAHIWPVADSTTTLSLENRPRRGGVSCLKSHKKSSQSRSTKFTYDVLEVWGSRLLISFAQTLHIPILRQPTPELKGSLEV